MRLIYVAGKGGVGKSVCSASTALWTSKQGLNTLAFSMDRAHSLSDILEVEIGGHPRRIADDLYAYEPDIDREAKRFFSRYKHMLTALFGLFEMEVRPEDFGSFPGVAEMIFMEKLYDVYAEDQYAVVVIDSAPTAMVLPLLQLPNVTTGFVTRLLGIKSKWMGILNMLEPGFGDAILKEARRLRAKSETMRDALLDPSISTISAVTIPEKAAVMETRRLIETVEGHGVFVNSIIINHVMEGDCDCSYCVRRRNSQSRYMDELQEAYGDKRIAHLSDFGAEIKGEDAIEKVAWELYGKGQLAF
ncbi:MAG: ArsA family ATPase [Methanotrichaceae archaeon]|nr:ArsA family ATPase [Methanotrichaceae archaeon]